MRRHLLAVALAGAGAAAYAISKVDLAIRGELGMPGFPAPAESYDQYDPVSGQLSNAVMGLVMLLLIAALARLPRRRWPRRALLAVNAMGVTTVAIGVVTFTVRATGVAPGLGAPATGPSSWLALAVGAGWVSAWLVALLRAPRARPSDAAGPGPRR